jgi:hypothetical protein
MKEMIFLGWLIMSVPAMLFAQERIQAPVWKVGDKWVFTQGNIEVIGADKKSYALNFSKDTCLVENVGFETIIFEKSTLNRIYIVKEDKREKYTQFRRRILNFPFNPGKQWQDTFTAKAMFGADAGRFMFKFSESFKVSGWEDVEVRAGKFKAIKLEYTQKNITPGAFPWEGWIRYWYSPDVKYFVKCQYDKDWMKENKEIFDWELASFKLKK